MTAADPRRLKAWDEALSQVEKPKDAEIAAAEAIVCARCPGVTPDDIREALRASIEELQGEVAAAYRVLKILEPMVKKREGNCPAFLAARRSSTGLKAQ